MARKHNIALAKEYEATYQSICVLCFATVALQMEFT
jgi:hypothetical protein